ncbi:MULTISPECIES: NlpC/P60 family protein [unclassified Ornithinimicrobium]|uniref:C40 family peptidase n=1 Tax=unclassified Ornithinimicrobium TaxID=2615080 RepID=UPI003852CF90
MPIRARSLSRTLIAVTAAAAPVMVLAPTAHAAPTTPQLPRSPLGLRPTAPAPAAPTIPLPTVEQTVTRWVSVPANVRSGPSTSYRVVGSRTTGDRVSGVLTSNGWLKISDTQFMAPSVLTSTDPGGGETGTTSVTRWVSVPVANVRSGPSTSYSISGTRTQGQEVAGTLTSNGWLRISSSQFMAPSVLTSTAPSTGGGGSSTVTQYLDVAIGNVRSGPGLGYGVVATMTRGTEVSGTWTNGWLDLGSGRFISGTILTSQAPAPSTPAPADPAPPAASVTRYVSAAVANVRSGPSTSYAISGTRTGGTEVRGSLTSNGWLKMSDREFMSPTVLTTSPPVVAPAPAPAPAPTPLREALIATAAQYVGYPYVLYGTPPEAFDCSSYTWWTYKQNGINIPRTVRDQRTFVIPVTDPQPGDLVFYKNYYHVGLYAGPGMSYEAQNPNTDVVYGPIWDDDVWYGRVPGM